ASLFPLSWCCAAGCSETATEGEERPTPPPIRVASQFDPAKTGEIHGRMVWGGSAPALAPYRISANSLLDGENARKMVRDNPHAPKISADGGVAGAVVFLRGIDPARARPWDHPPVRVSLQDRNITVEQGSHRSQIGFVRAGDEVEFMSKEPR